MYRSHLIKPHHLVALTVVLTLLAVSAWGAAPLPDRITVSWAPDSQLTEIKRNPAKRGWLRPNQWQKMLSDYLRRRADALLPPGQRLDVHVDDIQLAGSFEPWHGPNTQDIRIMREIYPPRIELHFTLTDADGHTIAQGSRRLSDQAYLQQPLPNNNDPLRYDKRVIQRWLHRLRTETAHSAAHG